MRCALRRRARAALRLNPATLPGASEVEPVLAQASVGADLRELDVIDTGLAVEDIAASVAHLRTIGGVKFIHLMGFCLGGRLAVLGAQIAGVTSAVSLYGVGIERHLDLLTRAKCPLQLHYGDRDRWVPNTAVETVRQVSAGRDIEIHVYPGINHGFFPRTRPGHNREASDTAWARIQAFMQQSAAH